MKKYLYSIVLATLILMSTTVVKAANEVYYVNRNNIEMTEEEYNNLLSLGFTEEYIGVMNQEEFIANKDIEGTLLSTDKKYIQLTTYMRNGIKITTAKELTKEEAMREKELLTQNVPTRGPVGSYYNGMVGSNAFEMTSSITGIGNTYMRFTNNIEWYTAPDDRNYDLIGIGIESNKVQRATGIVFNEHWIDGNGDPDYDETCAPKYESTGGLAAFKLPDGSVQTLYASLYFNVMKQPNVGTITSLYAVGDYAHATSYVHPDNLMSHVSVNVAAGLMIDATYSYAYVSIPEAVASFVGTW